MSNETDPMAAAYAHLSIRLANAEIERDAERVAKEAFRQAAEVMRTERDQLRADLLAEEKARMRIEDEANRISADLAAANRTIAQLREDAARERAQANEWLAAKVDLEKDAARVQGRLDEAERLLRDASKEPLAHKTWCAVRDFLDAPSSSPTTEAVASGSSTGEAAKCKVCGAPATCIGAYEGAEQETPACDKCCGHGNEDGVCRPIEPAAPEPAPAPTWRAHLKGCGLDTDHSGPCKVTHDCGPGACTAFDEPAAPASAQGTGEPIPLPILLHCPMCKAKHVDVGEFATKVHHTHACQSCGHVWRPAVAPTVGVEFLPGFKNDPAPPQPAPVERHGKEEP